MHNIQTFASYTTLLPILPGRLPCALSLAHRRGIRCMWKNYARSVIATVRTVSAFSRVSLMWQPSVRHTSLFLSSPHSPVHTFSFSCPASNVLSSIKCGGSLSACRWDAYTNVVKAEAHNWGNYSTLHWTKGTVRMKIIWICWKNLINAVLPDSLSHSFYLSVRE